MKIRNLYICVIMLFFTSMGHASEFDEFGGGGTDPFGFPNPSGDFHERFLATHLQGQWGFPTNVQIMIDNVLSSVNAVPQTSYSYGHTPATYSASYVISERELNTYNPKDLLEYLYTDETGQKWYRIYKNFVPESFDIIETTTMVNNNSIITKGYYYEASYLVNGSDFYNINSYGGINLGGIRSNNVTPTQPPSIFTSTTSSNLQDKLALTGSNFQTLLDNFKKKPYNSIRETIPYAYVDINEQIRIGYITIVRNTYNGETIQYFSDSNLSNYVKLPEINGQELHQGGDPNNDYTYNTGMVTVAKWNGSSNQAAFSENSVMLLDPDSGAWLIVNPVERSSSYAQVFPPKAYYNAIPRIVRNNVDYGPGSDREKAELLYQNNTSLTLEQALYVKREYFDVSIPDLKGAIDVEMQNLINKVSNGLPDDLKSDAEEILIDYAESEIVADTAPPSNTFEEGKNYVFDEEGKPKRAGATGNSIQIEVNGVLKFPSELDPTNSSQRMILTRVAIFLAQKIGAPTGSWFSTGKHSKADRLSSDVPAFTRPISPFMTVLNTRGGSYSKFLDNIYSFTNILQHELGHQANFKSINPHIPNNLSTHVDVYINAIETISFRNSPPEFKLSSILSLANYIWNMDKKPGYTFQQIKDKIDTFNSRSQFNGGYRLVAPKDPQNMVNILFTKGTLGNNDNFKVYNPLTNTEVSIIFNMNDEN